MFSDYLQMRLAKVRPENGYPDFENPSLKLITSIRKDCARSPIVRHIPVVFIFKIKGQVG